MSEKPHAFDARELLANARWLRRVARSLVLDAASADDALQQVWLKALERPPRTRGALGSWLARAVRSEVRQHRRSEKARARRERRVSVRETGAPSPTSVVERAEQLRRLTDLVLTLEEPYRETILLRYYEDLEPAKIARRQGVPGGTVRSRLKRGLDLLRERLDREHGDDRRAWALALLPLVHGEGDATATAAAANLDLLGGVLAMNAKWKALLVATFLIIPIGSVIVLTLASGKPAERAPRHPAITRHADPDERRAAPAEAPAVTDDVETKLKSRSSEPVKGEADAGAPSATPKSTEAVAVRLRFVDTGGAPLQPAEARRRFADGAVRLVTESLCTGGSIEERIRGVLFPPSTVRRNLKVTWIGDRAVVRKTIKPGRFRLFVLRPGAAPMLSPTFEAGGGKTPEIEIRLPRTVAGRRVRLVEDGTGQPVTAARVTPWFEYGDDRLFLERRSRTPDTAAEVVLPILEDPVRRGGRQPTWWAETTTHAAEISGHVLANARPSDKVVEVVLKPRSRISGEAWLACGRPAAGRRVIWSRKGLLIHGIVGQDGRFLLPGIPAAGHSETIVLVEDPAEARAGVDGVVLGATRVRLAPGRTAEVVIGHAPQVGSAATVVGRITAAGRPVAGAHIVAKAAEGRILFVACGSDGTYRLDGVPAGPAKIEVYFGDPNVVDDFVARPKGNVALAPGEIKRSDFDLPCGAFLVTVVDAETGRPVPGAVVLGRPEDRELERDRLPGYHYSPGWGGRADRDGKARLPAGMVPGAAHVLTAGAEGYRTARVKGKIPGMPGTPTKVTIRLKRR